MKARDLNEIFTESEFAFIDDCVGAGRGPTGSWSMQITAKLVEVINRLGTLVDDASFKALIGPMLDRDEKRAAPPSGDLSTSEALYGFMGWLVSREESITISSRHDAAEPAELVDAFCKANNLADPRDDFAGRLIYPEGMPDLSGFEIVGDSSDGRRSATGRA